MKRSGHSSNLTVYSRSKKKHFLDNLNLGYKVNKAEYCDGKNFGFVWIENDHGNTFVQRLMQQMNNLPYNNKKIRVEVRYNERLHCLRLRLCSLQSGLVQGGEG